MAQDLASSSSIVQAPNNLHFCWLQAGTGLVSVLELLNIYWAFTLEPCRITGKVDLEPALRPKDLQVCGAPLPLSS